MTVAAFVPVRNFDEVRGKVDRTAVEFGYTMFWQLVRRLESIRI